MEFHLEMEEESKNSNYNRFQNIAICSMGQMESYFKYPFFQLPNITNVMVVLNFKRVQCFENDYSWNF